MVGKTRDDVDRLVVVEEEEEEEEEGAEEVKGGVSGKDLLEAEVDAGRLGEETGVEEAGASDVLDVPDDEEGLSEVDSAVELGVEEVSRSDVVMTVVDCSVEVDTSVLVDSSALLVVDSVSWLEVVGSEIDEDWLLVVSTSEEVVLVEVDWGSWTLDVVAPSEDETEGIGVEVLLSPFSCRLPSKPATAGSASDESTATSGDVSVCSGQYSSNILQSSSWDMACMVLEKVSSSINSAWLPMSECRCLQRTVMRAAPLRRVKATKLERKAMTKNRCTRDILGRLEACELVDEWCCPFSPCAPLGWLSGSPASISASRCLSKEAILELAVMDVSEKLMFILRPRVGSQPPGLADAHPSQVAISGCVCSCR